MADLQRSNIAFVLAVYTVIRFLQSEFFTKLIADLTFDGIKGIVTTGEYNFSAFLAERLMSFSNHLTGAISVLTTLLLSVDPVILLCACMYILLTFKSQSLEMIEQWLIYFNTPRVTVKLDTDKYVSQVERVLLKNDTTYLPAIHWVDNGVNYYIFDNDIKSPNLFPYSTKPSLLREAIVTTSETLVSNEAHAKVTIGRVNISDSNSSGHGFRVGNNLVLPMHVFDTCVSEQQTLSKPGSKQGFLVSLRECDWVSRSRELDFIVLVLPNAIWSLLGVKSLTCGNYYTGEVCNANYECNGKTYTSQSVLTPDYENTMFSHDMNTLPGSSGTPIYNSKKQVVAMHVAHNTLTGRNMCLPSKFFSSTYEDFTMFRESDVEKNEAYKIRYKDLVNDYVEKHDPSQKPRYKGKIEYKTGKSINVGSGGISSFVEVTGKFKGASWADLENGPGVSLESREDPTTFPQVQSKTIKATITGNKVQPAQSELSYTHAEEDLKLQEEIHRKREVLSLKQQVMKLENSLTMIGQELAQSRNTEASCIKPAVSREAVPPVMKNEPESSKVLQSPQPLEAIQKPKSKRRSRTKKISTVTLEQPSSDTSKL